MKLYPSYQHYYPNEQRMYPLYQAAQDLGIPVLFHVGSSVFRGTRMKYCDPLHLDDVAVDFPELNLVMAHAGRGFWYDRAFFLAKLHANVYLEISGLPPSKLMTYFPELDRLTEKVIFGSDWPGMQWIRRNMEAIGKLPLPAEGVETDPRRQRRQACCVSSGDSTRLVSGRLAGRPRRLPCAGGCSSAPFPA